MSEWTHKNGIDGIKRQAQELIEQAYNRGYKAGYAECEEELAKEAIAECEQEKWIEQGRNEAWEAARKIGQNSQSGLEYQMGFDFSKMKSYESANPSWWVVMNYSASEAIEKIRAYEEKKKQEEDEIRVGDEVLLHGCAKAVVLRPKMRGLDNYCFIICADGSGGEWKKSELKKTGRTFPQIAEVLKKMGEGE